MENFYIVFKFSNISLFLKIIIKIFFKLVFCGYWQTRALILNFIIWRWESNKNIWIVIMLTGGGRWVLTFGGARSIKIHPDFFQSYPIEFCNVSSIGSPPLSESPNKILKRVWLEKACKKTCGDAGYRSPYLSHAKRALYHLSYIPWWDWIFFL